MPGAIAAAGAAASALWAAAVANPIIASVVVSAGLTAAQYALQRAQKGGDTGPSVTPRAVNTPESRLTIRDSTPVQQIILGKMRVSGCLAFPPVNQSPWLVCQWIHSVYPVTSFDTLRIGETVVPLSPSGLPLAPPYVNRLQVRTQTGGLGQPVNPLLASFLGYDSSYALPFANTAAAFHFGSDDEEHRALWEGGLPQLSWEIRGIPLPDPRNPNHILVFDPNDIAQVYAAIASWGWTDNAALAQMFWMMMPFGMNAHPSRMDHAAALPQIEFDDDMIGLHHRGGAERRYTANAFISLDQPPMQVMESLLTANRGHVVQRNGKLSVSSSRPKEPVMTITDDDLVGPMTFRSTLPADKRVDQVRAAFIAEERGYSDGEMTWPQDGGVLSSRPRIQSPRLGVTVGAPRAARILKSHYDQAQLERFLGLACRRRCLGLVEGDVFRFWSRRYPRRNGLYEVETWDYQVQERTVAYAASEYSPAPAIDHVPSRDEPEYPTSAELEAA